LPRDLWNWLETRFPDASLTLDTSPQLDLGIDSLAWTGLSLEIEDRLGVRLAEQRIARIITLRDLVRELEDAALEPAPESGPSMEQMRYLTPLNPVQRALGMVIYALFQIFMRGFFRLRVTGIEQLPESGPFVIVANHASWLDPVVIAASLPFATLRRARFAGWTGMMFNNIITRTFSRIARVFPVDPDRAAASSLALGRAVLDQGEILIWFPEGRRTHTGDLLPFQPGIGAVLEDSGVPVAPARITGTFEAAPAGRLIPHLTRIEIRYGTLLTAETLAGAPAKTGPAEKTPQRIANALHDAVAAT
jgi:long-chain acyl-CoA synthetase